MFDEDDDDMREDVVKKRGTNRGEKYLVEHDELCCRVQAYNTR